MDAPTRFAYLEAMGIPLWVSRDLPSATPEQDAPSPLSRHVPASPRREAPASPSREVAAKPIPTPDDKTPTADDKVHRVSGTQQLALCLVMGEKTLLVDEVAQLNTREQSELHLNLMFAIEGCRQPAVVEEFRWPPESGVPQGQISVSDVLMGKLSKLSESHTIKRALLLGEQSAQVAKSLNADCESMHAINGEQLMTQAGEKRDLWQRLKREWLNN